MKRDYRFWSEVEDLKKFNKVLCEVPIDYYLGIAKHYLSRSILDVGCGFGDTYNLFKRNSVDIDYVGLDVTERFIKICKDRYPDAVFSNAPAQNIPYPDDSFDMVTCRSLLEHLPDPEPAIREMARVSNEIVVIVWFIEPGPVEKLKFKKAGFWHNLYSRDRVLEIAASARLELEDEFYENRLPKGSPYPHLVWVLEKKT